jgi:hypothetical protein
MEERGAFVEAPLFCIRKEGRRGTDGCGSHLKAKCTGPAKVPGPVNCLRKGGWTA